MVRNSRSNKPITRSESGTCNVCSAPCSSCLHINRGLTTVKAEESSGETCQENFGSQNSMTDVIVKNSACDGGQQSAHEASNADLNCDIYYRDGKSKAGLKSCDLSLASSFPGGTVERSCNQSEVKNKCEEWNGKEGREDSTSCVTSGSEVNKLPSSDKKSFGLRHGLKGLSSPKNELIENICSEDKNKGARSSKLLSTLSDPSSGKSIACSSDMKDLSEKLCPKEHCNMSSTKEEAFELEVCVKLEEETDKGNAVASEKVGLDINLDSEIQTNIVTQNESNEVASSMQIKKTEEMDSCDVSDVQENNTESHLLINSEESDVFEQDVKVCDICGDAGREDKLAICSRCSDGAEHTYCMRIMIDKVPEGDWLCEECNDEIKLKQSSEVAISEDTSLLLNVDGEDLDAEATKTRKKLMGKRDRDDRNAENIETSPEAKKQFLGPIVKSPKALRGVASLSRDSSLKSLDKGERRPPHQLSSAGSPDNESPEDASSPRKLRKQTTRSTLFKSSSFSTHVKSKNDILGEVSRKQISTREPAYIDKDGSSKLIGRSMSFKPSSSSRLNSPESKVKMLSAKFSHPQDVKGLRQMKAQNILERKSSFKPERSVNRTISSSAPNADQKLAPTDLSLSNKEPKGVPVESKPSILSKSTSHITRKGEMKISSVSEQRSKETCLRDDSSLGTHTMEKVSNSRGGFLGVLPRPRTSIDSPRDIVNDASATRSSADVLKGNKLKAAIEAAMLKKPGVCRKNKPADQSDDVSISGTNLNAETRPEDYMPTSSKRGNTSSANETHEVQAISGNRDQKSRPIGSTSLKSGGNFPIVPSGLSNQSSATVSVLLKTPVLPEHEYIWQGDFHISKIGKLAVLRDGLQAHLSTCASPKVVEVVNKFPSKVLLNEVTRMSTWPVQFQEAGVKEDNIALYFFSKDLESYERSYKGLVETMMKRDVALKGNFDGVDLLIFPSNHLPQNAQRWNMLYFLWGVFRRKKVNCVQDVSNSGAMNASQASEHQIAKDLPGLSFNAESKNSESLALEGHTFENIKRVCNTKVSSGDLNGQFLRGKAEFQDYRVDAKRISGLSVVETKGAAIPLEEKADSQTKVKTDVPQNKIKTDVPKFQLSVQDAKAEISNTRQSSASSGPSVRASLSDDPETLERTVKEKEDSTDATSSRERNVTVSQATKEPNERQITHGKRPHEDLILEGPTASSTLLPERESTNKKQKTDSSVIGSVNEVVFPEMVPSIEGETKIPKRGIELDLNVTQDYTPDSPSPVAKQEKGCLFDLNVAQDYPDNDEDGDSSSLSLSFPFSNKDSEVKPASKMEPVLPGRSNTRSSPSFFAGLQK